MNQRLKTRFTILIMLFLSALLFLPNTADAQRMQRNGSRPGVSKPASKPTNRPAQPAARPSQQPAARPSQPAARPSQPAARPSTPAASPSTQASSRSRETINGGNRISEERKPSTPIPDRDGSGDRTNIGNNSNIGNNTNIGNKVDIDTGDKNVNINVDNSKDINIRNDRNNYYRPSPRPYYRPPYSYGGFHFYCHFGYSYHPYTPYYWGPTWHPWGFFLATLTATAIVVSVNNQPYHYDQGVFYEEANGGYTAVQAPNGAVVPEIPPGAEEVKIEQTVTNNYYYGGTYYEKGEEGYTVVPPTAGALVTNLPEGAEEVKVGDVTYVKYGDTLYQPVQVEGNDMYEVAQVEKAEE